jgi:chemotaxis protein MotB
MARKAKAAKAENHERWLITYADMITLLMVFFIVLYAGSLADAKKFTALAAGLASGFNIDPEVLKGSDPSRVPDATGSPELIQALVNYEAQIRKRLDEALMQRPDLGLGGAEITVNKEGILISMYGNMLFESGKATLRDEAIQLLDELTVELFKVPNRIRVEGHTDSVPPGTPVYPTNWELSSARSTAVVRYLEGKGLSRDRLDAAYYADTRPLAPNDDRVLRSRNRRVDIQILFPNMTEILAEVRKQSNEARQTGAVPGNGQLDGASNRAGGH